VRTKPLAAADAAAWWFEAGVVAVS